MGKKFSSAPFISVMNLINGFFQIAFKKRAKRYAAFVTSFGGYIKK